MATIEEAQEVSYYLLCNLDDICKELKIKMVLQYGTCLGAVRHNGFIPWDDDIDVMMQYKHIKKLKKYFKKHSNNINGISFSDFEFEHINPYNLKKLRYNASCTPAIRFGTLNINRGIGLDIFEYCYCAKNPKLLKIQDLLFGVTCMLHEKHYIRDKIKYGETTTDIYNQFIYRISEKMPECCRISLIKLLKIFTNLLGSKKSGKFFAMSEFYTMQKTPSIKICEETIECTFVDRMFNIPKDYDEYLTREYGEDYMTPKPGPHLDTGKMFIYLKPGRIKS